MSAEVGLREMRQAASELVRRAEAGETLTITVAGRPAAVLGPVQDRRWRRWAEIEPIFGAAVDSDFVADLELVDNEPRDPWDSE